MPQKIKIAIAEDHALMRDGYLSLLSKESNLSVIGVAENGKKLLELLENKTPNIILLDHDMPVMNGLEALKLIKERHPEIRTIIVSMYDDELLVTDYFANGAVGFVNKNCSAAILLETINTVNKNGICISKENSDTLIKKIIQKEIKSIVQDVSFSERELEIIRSIHAGKTNKEIAAQLNLSLKTIDFHKAKIYKKTNTYTSAGIVVYAIKLGLVG